MAWLRPTAVQRNRQSPDHRAGAREHTASARNLHSCSRKRPHRAEAGSLLFYRFIGLVTALATAMLDRVRAEPPMNRAAACGRTRSGSASYGERCRSPLGCDGPACNRPRVRGWAELSGRESKAVGIGAFGPYLTGVAPGRCSSARRDHSSNGGIFGGLPKLGAIPRCR